MAIDIAGLIGAFFVLSLISIVFKETIFFSFAERTFIGVTLGITITMAVQTLINLSFIPLMRGDFSVVIPIILGVLMWSRFSAKNRWLSFYPLVILTGVSLALMTRTAIEAQIIQQIKPVLTNKFITGDLYTTTGNIYNVVALFTGLSYFLFATQELPAKANKIIGYSSRIGRYVLVMMLGSAFANVVLGRSSMFLERIQFVLHAIGLIP